MEYIQKIELESCAEIYYGKYSKISNIEATTMIEMASKQYIPAIIKYMNDLVKTIKNIKRVSNKVDVSVTEQLLIETSTLLSEAKNALENLKVK